MMTEQKKKVKKKFQNTGLDDGDGRVKLGKINI